MPGAAPAQAVGPEEGRSPFPHVLRSGLGELAGAPQHGGGRLLSCVHSSVPTSPGNTTPTASPEVASPLAGHTETLLNPAPPSREGQRCPALGLPPTRARPSLTYRLNTVLLGWFLPDPCFWART